MQIRIDLCDPRAQSFQAFPQADQTHLSKQGRMRGSVQGTAEPPTSLADAPSRGTDSTLSGAEALRCSFEAPLRTLVAHTPAQVVPLLNEVQALSQQGYWCVGYLRYEAASAFDAALTTHAADGPLAWFGVFERASPWPLPGTPTPTPVPVKAGTSTPTSKAAMTPATAPTPPVGMQWRSSLSQAQFDDHMGLIHQAIAAGEFYQVNYTAPLHSTLSGSAPALFERLQRAQPGGYAAYIDTGAEQILSVSPELFFDWNDEHILARPMKGTAPRDDNPAEDAALAQELTQSAKERAENVMIVDLLRNDLSRVAQPHTVQVPRLFAVHTLPTVHQMVSDVTAQTRPGTTLADVFTALFPCGSITGAPKVRAMQMIRELEPTARGVYCGTIGVLRPGGHATFSVAIRTVTLQGDRASCGIGSGITADATASAEWQEWQHKRNFLERASQPFNLLETLRLQDGDFVNLGAHLTRLARAATHFAYPFNEARCRLALQALLPNREWTAPSTQTIQAAHTSWRVRLLLDAQGGVFAEKFELQEPLTHALLALAATPFEACRSEFTRFKTTHRAHYESFAPADPQVFDTLLYNPRGELTECTRGNIAMLLDGQWVTPPLHCGLLGGVGRELYLQRGRLTEAVVRVEDLPRVQGLAFVNSVRGWIDAKLV